MATVYTRTIGSVGRDYATPALAYADVSTIVGTSNLVGADAQVIFEIYDDSVFTARNSLVGGYITDETRNIVFRKAASSGRPLFKPTSGSGHVFTVAEDHLIFEDLDVEQYSGAGTSDEDFRVGQSGQPCLGLTIRRCKLKNIAGTSQTDCVYVGNINIGSATYPVLLQDCQLIGANRAGVHMQQYTSGTARSQYIDIRNLTIADAARGIAHQQQNGTDLLEIVIKNTAIIDSSIEAFGASGGVGGTLTTTGSTNNFDEDSTLPGAGTPNPITATDNATPGAGDWAIFTNLTGYADLHLQDVAANDVIDGGIGPASDSDISTTDLDGVTRSGTTCEPGCYEIAAASGVTGNADITEAADTVSASGDLPIAGTSTVTESADTVSSTADLPITGTSTNLEAADSLSSTGSAGATGDSNITESADTASSQGDLNISATSVTTEAADSITSTGNLSISGTSSNTEAADTLSSTGDLDSGLTGDASILEAADTAASSASLPITGESTNLESADTAVSSGQLPISGESANTEASDTLSSDGDVGFFTTGNADITEAADTVSSDGTTVLSGNASVLEASDTLVSTGSEPGTGNANITEAADTSIANGVIATEDIDLDCIRATIEVKSQYTAKVSVNVDYTAQITFCSPDVEHDRYFDELFDDTFE